MKIPKRKSGVIIGAMFAVACLLLTFTFIVPIFSVLPGSYIENVAKLLVNNEPYSNVGLMTILLLSIIFLSVLFLLLRWIRSSAIRDGYVSHLDISVLMFLLFFIIQPLGFYLMWGMSMGFRSDGQLALSVLGTFPVSGFGFILIGWLVDYIKNKHLKTAE